MATILDVARRARVSPSTVSNFINDRMDRMQASTRERIERAVDELGFTPNLVARQLKTGHAPMIGLFVPTVANPFYGELATAIQVAAQARGYQVLLYNTRRDAERELAFAAVLSALGVKGLITASAMLGDAHASALGSRGLAVVAFDGPEQAAPDPQVDVVALDNSGGVRMAVAHLVGLGHRRITYVTMPPHNASRAARLAGFGLGVAEHGLAATAEVHEIAPEGARSGDDMIGELGRRAGCAIAALELRPTAVVASNDLLAVGISAGLREAGIVVPDEISLVGIDDLFLAPLLNPPLTSIRQPFEQMAAKAVDCLVARIEGRESQARSHIFPPELVVRRSTAPVAADPSAKSKK